MNRIKANVIAREVCRIDTWRNIDDVVEDLMDGKFKALSTMSALPDILRGVRLTSLSADVEEIPAWAFTKDLTSLQVGSKTNLSGIGDMLHLAPNLEKLSVRVDGVTEMPEGLKYSGITQLELYGPSDVVTKMNVSNLPHKLEELRVESRASLEGIPDLPSLKCLNLSSDLGADDLSKFPNLEAFTLYDCQGSDLESIYRLDKLKDLVLVAVGLSDFPYIQSRVIEYIDLTGNSIEELSPKDVNHLRRIVSIDLSGNPIRREHLPRGLSKKVLDAIVLDVE